MNTIGIITEQNFYNLLVPLKYIDFYNGIINTEVKFGDFIVDFLDMDLSEIMNNLNPIVYNKDYLTDYLFEVQQKISKKYNPFVTGMLLNCIESIIISCTKDSVTSKIREDFFLWFNIQNQISEFLLNNGTNPSFTNILFSAQNITVKFDYINETKPFEIVYGINDLFSLLAFDINHIIKKNILIKRCSNCGKYFIPSKRTDEIYCDRIFKSNRTCKQVGYEEKEKKDPFSHLYTKARKTQYARIAYNSHIKDYREKHYVPWKKAAEQARESFKKSNDFEGFKKWIEENKNSF